MNLHVRELLWKMALKIRECDTDSINHILDGFSEKIELAVRIKDEYLTEKQVAERYPILDVKKLRNFRQRGGGPQFFKFGDHRNSRVFYKIADIEQWIVEKVRRSRAFL